MSTTVIDPPPTAIEQLEAAFDVARDRVGRLRRHQRCAGRTPNRAIDLPGWKADDYDEIANT